MKRKKYFGRRLVFWGALILLGLAGWELYVRGETVWWTIEGLINLCRSEGVPFMRAISYFDAGMIELLFFLSGLTLFSLISLILRNRPRWGIWLILLAGALGALGGLRFGWLTDASEMLGRLTWLKLFPLLMIVIGCGVNLAQFFAFKRRESAEEPAQPRQRLRKSA